MPHAPGASAAPRSEALFVYGSLRSPHPAHALVSPYVTRTAPASTTGRLLALPDGYPGLVDVVADAAARVTGELLQLRDPDAAFAVLDRYEGDAYRRVLRAITLADGSEHQAWCYTLTPTGMARGGQPIPGGDWLAWLRAAAP
jgi:gamma-glutamylcyclotransferase (GGCT)/AIG2-like uncharacterized protein YtfP